MSGARVAILIADDRRENVIALRAILDDPSYEIVGVTSGAAAVDVALHRDDLAVLLLDVHMPGMDGLETARKIRAAGRRLPIIFLTADSFDAKLTAQAYAIGAVDYLIKPLDADAVSAKVAVFVDLHRKSQQIRDQEVRLRERSAEALRESEALYEATFNQAPVGIAHLSPSGTWQRVNEHLCAMLSMSPGDLLGGDLGAVIHADDADALHGALERMVLGTQAHYAAEVRLLPKDAPAIWTDVMVSILRDRGGSPRRVICIAQDATARKRAEEAERFLGEASELLIGSLDVEAALRDFSELAVPRLADLCIVELAERTEPVAVVHADPEIVRAVSRTRSRPLAPVRRLELRVLVEIAEDGSADAALWAHGLRALVVLPLVGRGGPVGQITLARQSAFDAVDLGLLEHLGHRAALAVENGMLYAQTQQAVRMRDEFLSIASHELRTPLTPLQMQLQRLTGARGRSLVESLGPDKLQGILSRAEHQVERLAALIDNLLDVSRISSGKLKLDLEASVDLREVARDVTGRFQEELARAGCMLVLRADGPVLGQWDMLRLEQVLTNLLSNAVKYGPGHPVEVEVSEAGTQGVLRVVDHGIGVPADKIDKIFDRFERAVSARSYGGLGLGLYITRQIVEAHGGHITVASEQGEGAAFTVELPLSS